MHIGGVAHGNIPQRNNRRYRLKQVFQIGDKITLEFTVEANDIASFNNEEVHPFYSTFALGRDAEWTCRQFVLKMKEADEEGIGTFLNIRHLSPAMIGSRVQIESVIVNLKGNQIDCEWEARIGDRVIAQGEQGQKILKHDKVQRLKELASN